MAKDYYFFDQTIDKCKDPGSPIIPIKLRYTGKSWHFEETKNITENRKSKVVEKPL